MIYLHFSFQNMTYLCIFSCHPKSDTAQVTVACDQALHLWLRENELASFFRVLLSRDFSRLPLMESLLAG